LETISGEVLLLFVVGPEQTEGLEGILLSAVEALLLGERLPLKFLALCIGVYFLRLLFLLRLLFRSFLVFCLLLLFQLLLSQLSQARCTFLGYILPG
jgi:hypothetical protein